MKKFRNSDVYGLFCASTNPTCNESRCRLLDEQRMRAGTVHVFASYSATHAPRFEVPAHERHRHHASWIPREVAELCWNVRARRPYTVMLDGGSASVKLQLADLRSTVRLTHTVTLYPLRTVSRAHHETFLRWLVDFGYGDTGHTAGWEPSWWLHTDVESQT